MNGNNTRQVYGQQSIAQKQIPVGVKIISVLDWIGAVIMILAGLLFIGLGIFSFGGGASSIERLEQAGGLFAFLGAFALIGGIILLGLGIFYIFVARGLWKGRNWARIAQIIFACIGMMFAIFGLIQLKFGNIFSLVISCLIAGYLLFSKKVKEAFS